jgi:hypothetical protein
LVSCSSPPSGGAAALSAPNRAEGLTQGYQKTSALKDGRQRFGNRKEPSEDTSVLMCLKKDDQDKRTTRTNKDCKDYKDYKDYKDTQST